MRESVREFNDFIDSCFEPSIIERAQTLLKAGYDSNTDTATIDQFLRRTYGSLDLTFIVTENCNLRCTYCYELHKNCLNMDPAIGKEFIDKLLAKNSPYANYNYCNSYSRAGVVVNFIGGEPLLAIDEISEISDYFIKKAIELHHPWAHRFKLNICSNGTLYFSPKFQAFMEKHHQHLHLAISIDGNKQLHDTCRVFPNGAGSYDQAIAAVHHCKEHYGYMPGIKLTLCPENLPYFYESFKNLIHEGYTEIYANCVFEDVWKNIEDAKLLYQQCKQVSDYIIDHDLENSIYLSLLSPNDGRPISSLDLLNSCGGTGNMLAVDCHGDLYPCARYSPLACPSQKPLIIGTVKDGIGTTPEQIAVLKELDTINRRTSCDDKCFNCPISLGCNTCYAQSYEEYGTINKKCIHNCDTHKARALAIAYLEFKTAIKNNTPTTYKLYIPEEWALEIISQEEWQMLKELEERAHLCH